MAVTGPRRIIVAGLVVWALTYGWSWVTLWITEPTGDGFTRGLNRVTTFFGWQFAAGVVALALFIGRGQLAPGSALRRGLWGPLILALLPVAFVLGVFAWAWIQHLIWTPQS